jgi:hypothetical protein
MVYGGKLKVVVGNGWSSVCGGPVVAEEFLEIMLDSGPVVWWRSGDLVCLPDRFWY